MVLEPQWVALFPVGKPADPNAMQANVFSSSHQFKGGGDVAFFYCCEMGPLCRRQQQHSSYVWIIFLKKPFWGATKRPKISGWGWRIYVSPKRILGLVVQGIACVDKRFFFSSLLLQLQLCGSAKYCHTLQCATHIWMAQHFHRYKMFAKRTV